MTIQPLSDRILVRHFLAGEAELPSGLILPDVPRPQLAGSAALAEVLAVGPGRRDRKGRLVPMSCRVGDTVLVQRDAGARPEPLDDAMRLLHDDGILAVVEGAQRMYGGVFLGGA